VQVWLVLAVSEWRFVYLSTRTAARFLNYFSNQFICFRTCQYDVPGTIAMVGFVAVFVCAGIVMKSALGRTSMYLFTAKRQQSCLLAFVSGIIACYISSVYHHCQLRLCYSMFIVSCRCC